MSPQRWQQKGDVAKPKAAPRKAAAPSPGGPRGRSWRRRTGGDDESRLPIGAMISGGVALLLLAAAGFIVWQILPAPPPPLVTISATYPSGPVPPNVLAPRDAKRLVALSEIITPKDAGESLDKAGMLKQLAGIRSIKPPTRLFRSEETVAIVYVNAIGVSLPDGKPVLLPSDIPLREGLKDKSAGLEGVPVEDVAHALKECVATHKLLVLDCQRVERLWPMGVVENTFVRDVEHLLLQNDYGIYCLLSCSPGQLSWMDLERQGSVFGLAFAEGLAGAAETTNADNRLSLKELVDYVTKRVQNFAALNRAYPQDPKLLVPAHGQPELVYLAPEPEAPKMDKVPHALPGSELKAVWQQFFERKKEGAADLSEVAASLLRADALWLAGDETALQGEIRAARNLLEGAGQTERPAITPYSFAMAGFLGRKEQYKKRAQALDDMVKTKSVPLDAPAAKDRTVEEQELAIHLAFEKPSSPESPKWIRDQLVARMAVEDAAVPLGDKHPALTPIVARWIRGQIDDADMFRRMAEDATAQKDPNYLALGPSLDPGEKQPRERAKEIASQAKKDAEILADAWRLRDELVFLAPYLARFAAEVSRFDENESASRGFPDRELAREILSQTAHLVRLSDIDPKNKWPGFEERSRAGGSPIDAWEKGNQERAEHLKLIQKVAENLETARKKWLEAFQKFTRELAGDTGPAATQHQWHQIDELVQLPCPDDPTDPGRSAKDHLTLLGRLRASKSSSSERVSSDLQGDAKRGERVREQGLQAAASLLKIGGVAPEAKPKATELRASWQNLFATSTGDSPWEKGARNATRQSLLEGFGCEFGSERQRQRRALARGALVDFYLWHARRMAEDFYASLEATEKKAYFDQASSSYIAAARKYDPAAGKEVEQRLEKLRPLELKMEAEGKQPIVFAGYDYLPLSLRASAPARDFPSGRAVIRFSGTDAFEPILRGPDRGSEGSSTVPPTASSGVELSVLMKRRLPLDKEAKVDFQPRIHFRGHQAMARAEMHFINEKAAPTTTYVNDLRDKPKIVVRSKTEQPSDAVILFVLDCSNSMNRKNRLSTLKEVLKKFAEGLSDGAIQVGIRVFGARVPLLADGNPGKGAEADTKNILPIGPLNVTEFIKQIDELKATGATPLFKAIEEARNDVLDSSKLTQLIVISDGEDNWIDDSAIAERLGQLDRLYAGSNIRVHTVGFRFDGEEQVLKDIAKKLRGTYRSADESDALLEQITDLSGLARYHIRDLAKRQEADDWLPIRPSNDEQKYPPGKYEILVRDGEREVPPQVINARAGQVFVLLYDREKRRLEFKEMTLDDIKAVPTEAGKPRVHIHADAAENLLRVTAGVYEASDGSPPPNLRFQVSPSGTETPLILPPMPPNVPGHRLPLWSFKARPWPARSGNGKMLLRWHGGEIDSERIDFADWNKKTRVPGAHYSFRGKEGASLMLTRWKTPTNISSRFAKVEITLVCEPPKEIVDWHVDWEDAIVRGSEQSYDTAQGVYSASFDIEGEAPRTLRLRRLESLKSSTLEVPFEIGAASVRPLQAGKSQ